MASLTEHLLQLRHEVLRGPVLQSICQVIRGVGVGTGSVHVAHSLGFLGVIGFLWLPATARRSCQSLYGTIHRVCGVES